jgi:hypothetical protein
MKKIFSIIFFNLLMYSATAQVPPVEPPQPPITDSVKVTFTLPDDYPYKADHSTVSGTIYYYIHNNSMGSIIDPIIVPEGFDPTNERHWPQLYKLLNQSNMMQCMHDMGYDFIVINFENGGNYLEHNAYLVSKIIQLINFTKISNHQNIVVGPSMGGVISRYALTYMEFKDIPHNTRLFISYDSPQMGANVPMGVQFVVNILDGEPGVPNKYYMLQCPAARELLISHIEATLDAGYFREDPLRTAFVNNLSSIGNWPKQLRKVAITNGSGYGLKQVKNDGFTLLEPGDEILARDIFDSGNHAYAVPVAGNRIKVGRAKYPGKDPQELWLDGVLPYDNMPGGYRGFTKEIDKNTANAFNQCFVPVYSALGINRNESYYNVHNDPTVLSSTPFDTIYYSYLNTEHVSISPENRIWLENEIIPYRRLHIYSPSIIPPRGAVDLASYGEVSLMPGGELTGEIGGEMHIYEHSPSYCSVPAAALNGIIDKQANHIGTYDIQDSQVNNPGTIQINNLEKGITETAVTGMGEINSLQGLAVYPNPSDGKVTVSNQRSALRAVEVVNVSGVQVSLITGLSDYTTTIDLSSLGSGLYLLKVNTADGQIHYQKLTIE